MTASRSDASAALPVRAWRRRDGCSAAAAVLRPPGAARLPRGPGQQPRKVPPPVPACGRRRNRGCRTAAGRGPPRRREGPRMPSPSAREALRGRRGLCGPRGHARSTASGPPLREAGCSRELSRPGSGDRVAERASCPGAHAQTPVPAGHVPVEVELTGFHRAACARRALLRHPVPPLLPCPPGEVRGRRCAPASVSRLPGCF